MARARAVGETTVAVHLEARGLHSVPFLMDLFAHHEGPPQVTSWIRARLSEQIQGRVFNPHRLLLHLEAMVERQRDLLSRRSSLAPSFLQLDAMRFFEWGLAFMNGDVPQTARPLAPPREVRRRLQ